MTEKTFDKPLSLDEIFELLEKYDSPGARSRDLCRFMIVEGSLTTPEKIAEAVKAQNPRHFILRQNDYRSIAETVQFDGLIAYDPPMQTRGPGFLQNILFFIDERTGADHFSTISRCKLGDEPVPTANAFRNALLLNMIISYSPVAEMQRRGKMFTLPGPFHRFCMKEVARIFEGEGDSFTPAFIKAASEVNSLFGSHLDGRVYPDSIQMIRRDVTRDLHINLLAPESIADPDFSASCIVKNFIFTQPQQLVQIVEFLKARDMTDEYERAKTFIAGGIDPEFVENTAKYMSGLSKAEQDSTSLHDVKMVATSLQAILTGHSELQHFSPEAHKNLMNWVDNNELHDKKILIMPENYAAYYHTMLFVVAEQAAKALRFMAPKACLEAGLDLDLVEKVRSSIRPASPAGGQPGGNQHNYN